ncbi:hypothetical protein DL96DRAFT_1805669 [Flagelloscypha sp. PMI_526]|nr:hypothetical protein DL96DRAFT_1805669 [Flagelloscypha sp. PMI_526]
MISLPPELFLHILKYLPLEPLKQCALVNTTLHEVTIPFLSHHLSLGLLEPRHLKHPRDYEKLDVIQCNPWKGRISRYTEELSIGEGYQSATLPFSRQSEIPERSVISPSSWIPGRSKYGRLETKPSKRIPLSEVLRTCPNVQNLTIEPYGIEQDIMVFAHSQRVFLRRLVLSFNSPWNGGTNDQLWHNLRSLLQSTARTLSSLVLGPSVMMGAIASTLIRAPCPALETLTLRWAAEKEDDIAIPFRMLPNLQTLVIELEFRNPLNAGILLRTLNRQFTSTQGSYQNLRTLEIRALEVTTKFTTHINPIIDLDDFVEISSFSIVFVLQMGYLYEEEILMDALFHSAARRVKKWLPAWEGAGRLVVVISQLLQAPWIFPEQVNRFW